MRKILLIIPFIVLLVGCVSSQKYQPQPVVIRELSTLPGAAKVDSFYIFAEDYASHSRFDFSKANLKAVQLTLQNASYGSYATTYQFNYTDFHGIGSAEYMPYSYSDAYALMNNSAEFSESVKGAAVGTLGGGILGAAIGAAAGALLGADAASGAAAGAAVGAVVGGTKYGFEGHSHYKAKASIAVNDEIQSRKMPDLIAVQPNSKITGVLFFPIDTHTIISNFEGFRYSISIHSLESIDASSIP